MVKVVRYEAARWAVVQAVLPIAMLAGIASRRLPGPATYGLAIGMLLLASWLILRARRGFGKQTLQRGSGKAILKESGEELSRRTTSRWTLSNRAASLYGSSVTYKLRLVQGDQDAFEALLKEAVGERTQTTPRGTARARIIAAAVFVLGLAALGTAIALQSVALMVAGVLVAVGGGAHGVLSQHIVGSVKRGWWACG